MNKGLSMCIVCLFWTCGPGVLVAQVKYDSAYPEHRNLEQDQQRSVTDLQKQAVMKTLEQMREHIRRKNYDAAWQLFAEDSRRAVSLSRDEFQQMVDADLFEKLGFFDFHVDSIVPQFGCLRMTGTRDHDAWAIDFVEEKGHYVIKSMQRTSEWKKRVLPKMQKRSEGLFDIYYTKGSTAEKDIEHIIRQRRTAFRELCDFLGRESEVRICLVFFEDEGVKAAETGHQGAGWAIDQTIVEVYNEHQKMNPYHEMVHILMQPYGNPPAALDEGFAVYMSERLGAPALAALAGGHPSIYERAKEWKGKSEWISLSELLTYTEIGPPPSRPTVSYPEAAAFVKFLIERYGKDKFLDAYRTLRSSADQAVQQENITSLEQIYSRPFNDLDKEWTKTF